MILWGSTGGGVSKGHYTENVHKTLSRLALGSFCSLKSFFFIRRGRFYHYDMAWGYTLKLLGIFKP